MTTQITTSLPVIIQGGMGVYVSTPFLAREVSMNEALGTVSGVAPERIMARILARGDVGGHYRRALSHFPFPKFAEQVLDAFYIEEGNPHGLTTGQVPFFSINPPDILIALSICANFAFVWLAKEGHGYPISINYLEKIAMPHIYAITGAMLAGVDYITMGAGIPRHIPDIIRDIAEGRTASYEVPVFGRKDGYRMSFNPEKFFGEKLPPMNEPGFIPIFSSNILPWAFKKAKVRMRGFVIERKEAGGHNAPPRRNGEYGPDDEVDYKKIRDLGIPFWIGGAMASPEKLKEAQSVGAVGIQVGSIFALCDRSGLRPDLRSQICSRGFKELHRVKTHMEASPTGFPLKVVSLTGSLSEDDVYDSQIRVCNHGALRTLFVEPDGSIGYRCPAEPIESYVRKGGAVIDTKKKRCVCKGLLAGAGLGDPNDVPLITMGDDVSFLEFLMDNPDDSYGVVEALAYLRGHS